MNTVSSKNDSNILVRVLQLIVIGGITTIISAGTGFLLGGVAFTAFFYTVDKAIVHNRGNLWKNYWKSFRMNIKNGFSLSLVIIVVSAAVVYGLSYINNGRPSKVMTIIYYVIIVELVMVSMYSFVILAKFDFLYKEVLMRGLIFGHKHFIVSIAILMVIGMNVALGYYVNLGLPIFTVGFSGYVISRLILERVLVKYSEPGALTKFDED